ncbi:hypothetical protein RHGRI_009566 [Rhododendron griersonianum]|uniref:Uncharacterized protein n=1 Tax=Rhododendron griersonianum TaxID=479676 RepID=A0AAV6KFV3_9ERIC|nr:hypothetical protein RHGRI_009566 [Rhododendron griersonianum]
MGLSFWVLRGGLGLVRLWQRSFGAYGMASNLPRTAILLTFLLEGINIRGG